MHTTVCVSMHKVPVMFTAAVREHLLGGHLGPGFAQGGEGHISYTVLVRNRP